MGPQPRIAIEMTVAQHKALRGIRDVIDQFKVLDKTMTGVGGSGAKASEKMDSGFTNIKGSIGKAVAAFMGLNAGMAAFGRIVSTVREEVERWRAQHIAAADVGEAFEKKLMELQTFAATGVAPHLQNMTIDQKRDYVIKNSGRVPKLEALASGHTAISGGSTMMESDRFAAGIETAKYMQSWEGGDKEQAGKTAVMLMEAYKKEGMTVEAAVGYIQGAAATSTLTEMKLILENLIQPMVSLSQLGYPAERAAEMFVGGQILTADTKGASNRTQVVTNAKDVAFKVASKYPEFRDKGYESYLFMTGQGKYSGDDRALEANRAFMGDLHKELFDKTGFKPGEMDFNKAIVSDLEGRARVIVGAMRQWQWKGDNAVTDDRTRDILTATESGIGSPAEMAARLKAAYKGAINKTRIYQSGLIEEKAVERLGEADAVQVRGEFEKMKAGSGKATGVTNIPRRGMEWLAAGLRRNPDDEVQEYDRIIRYKERDLREIEKKVAGVWGLSPLGGWAMTGFPGFLYGLSQYGGARDLNTTQQGRADQIRSDIIEYEALRAAALEERDPEAGRPVRVVEDESRAAPAVHPEETPALGGMGWGFGAGGQ